MASFFPTVVGQKQDDNKSLLVEVRTTDTYNIDVLKRKLEMYFQSKKSNGGECEVTLLQGTAFIVTFTATEVQQQVLEKTDHKLEIEKEKLRLIVRPYKNSESDNENSTAANIQTNAQNHLEEGIINQNKPNSKYSVQKIFLQTSVSVNSSLFTKEQMQAMCKHIHVNTSLKLDGMVVKGEYEDIVQFHQYLEELLSDSKYFTDDSPLRQENNVCKNYDGTELEKCIKVPWVQYEYFLSTHKKEIENIEKTFSVKIKARVLPHHLCSLTFIPADEYCSEFQAKAYFIDCFRKAAFCLSQDAIPLVSEPEAYAEILKTAKQEFGKVFLKTEGNELILRGPKEDIELAKRYIVGEMQQCEESRGARPQKRSTELKEQEGGITETTLKVPDFQGKKLHFAFDELQNKNPHVIFREKNGALSLLGPSYHVRSAKKHIMRYFEHAADVDSTWNSLNGDTSDEVQIKINGLSSEQFQQAAAAEDETENRCPICLDRILKKTTLKCKHEFCDECISQALKIKPVCPICSVPYGIIKGNQPDGTMECTVISYPLPGYQCGTIQITYYFGNGIQKENHPNPGKMYSGTVRKAYLPNDKEGNEILALLKKAFEQKLIFTIGQSRTTGVTDTVTWNDIHHKTSLTGGPANFGFPDRDYFRRVREELKAKGIV